MTMWTVAVAIAGDDDGDDSSDDDVLEPLGHTGRRLPNDQMKSIGGQCFWQTTPGFNAWPLSARDHHGLAARHREILPAYEQRSEWHEASRVPFCGPHQLHDGRA